MPLWARSGDELFYRLLDGAVVAVGVESGTVWRNGRPTQVVPPGYFFVARWSALTTFLPMAGDS
jgi:hypothetical protein